MLLLPLLLPLSTPGPLPDPPPSSIPAGEGVVADRLDLEPGTRWSYRGTLRVDYPAFRTAFERDVRTAWTLLGTGEWDEQRFLQRIATSGGRSEIADRESENSLAYDALALVARGVDGRTWVPLTSLFYMLDTAALERIHVPPPWAPCSDGAVLERDELLPVGFAHWPVHTRWSSSRSEAGWTVSRSSASDPPAEGATRSVQSWEQTWVIDAAGAVTAYRLSWRIEPGTTGQPAALDLALELEERAMLEPEQLERWRAGVEQLEAWLAALTRREDLEAARAELEGLVAPWKGSAWESGARALLATRVDVEARRRGTFRSTADALEQARESHATSARRLARLLDAPAPALDGRGLDGEPLDLEALRGKVVLLAFWAVDCAPCMEELPVLRALVGELGPDGLVVVGVNTQEDVERETAFAREADLPWPQVLGATGTDEAYLVQAIPHNVLIDRAGDVRGCWSGLAPGRMELIASAAAALLAEPPPRDAGESASGRR